ncbi:MAG: sigma-70 family RNA polymerase sigma factor [Sporichthyaceae bacterium]
MEIPTPLPRHTPIQAVPTPGAVNFSARCGEETSDAALFLTLRTAGGAEREWIQDTLVRRYAGLVRWVAGRYTGRGIDTDELRQVGYVGLVLAIDRYDPGRGANFRTFATPTVKGEIQRYFRDKRRWIQLPRRMQEIKAVLGEATEELTHALARPPTAAELADHLDVDIALVLEASIRDTFTITSLDQPLGESVDDSSIGDSLGCEDNRIDLLIDCAATRPLIAALAPRLQLILYLRFYDDCTQSEIGEQLGISQMQVSRLLTRTLHTLRVQLSDAAA